MPISEFDLPLTPSAALIRGREFSTVRRGYDPVQVRNWLKGIADRVDALEENLREAQARADEQPAPPTEPAAPAVDPYEELGNRMAWLLTSAEKEAAGFVGDAKAEAARILEEARAESDRMRAEAASASEEARHGSSEALDKAKLEVDQMFNDLVLRRKSFLAQVERMRSRLLLAAGDLEKTLEGPMGSLAVDALHDIEGPSETVILPELAAVEGEPPQPSE